MSNEPSGEPPAEPEPRPDRWLADRPVTGAALPADVRAAMGRFIGERSSETLGDWVGELRRRSGGGSSDADDLCHASDETSHWGVVDGEKYHFRCFYDAVALAELADVPVDVHTECPDGSDIESTALGSGDVRVAPATAAVSFGIARDVPSGADPTLREVYTAICQYVRAFRSRAAYENWARATPASTVGMPFASGVDVATELVA